MTLDTVPTDPAELRNCSLQRSTLDADTEPFNIAAMREDLALGVVVLADHATHMIGACAVGRENDVAPLESLGDLRETQTDSTVQRAPQARPAPILVRFLGSIRVGLEEDRNELPVEGPPLVR